MRSDKNAVIAQKAGRDRGVFAVKEFTPGDLIFEMKGALMTAADIEAEGVFSSLSERAYRFSETLYLNPIGETADALRHSCEPNAYVYKSHNKLYVRALKKIRAKAEVRIDYSTLMADDDNWSARCNCGAKECRKVIKRFSLLPKKLQEKYKKLNMVPSYIYSIADICANSLESQNLGLRRQSILALSNIGFDAAVQTLSAVLQNDASSVIRHDAAFVFGMIQDKRAIPYLVNAIEKDDSDLVRHEAIEALGDIGVRTGRVEKLLSECLRDPSPIIKDTAEMALVTLGELEK